MKVEDLCHDHSHLCSQPLRTATLTLATMAVIGLGIALTVSRLSGPLGFTSLPWQFFLALPGFTVAAGRCHESGVLNRTRPSGRAAASHAGS